MFLISPFILLLVVIGVIALIAQSRQGTARPEPPLGPLGDTAPHDDLERALARWQSAGLLDDEQAAAILAFESPPVPAVAPAAPARRIPVVAEALGYLGGTLGIVGLSLLLARYWPDLSTPARLGLTATAALVLTGAGALVPHRDEPAFERLRGFVWLAATAAVALTAGVVAQDAWGATYGPTIALTCAAAVTVHSALLWRGRTRPAQQFTCLVGGLVTVGTLVAQWYTVSPIGIAVLPVAAALLVVGLRHVGPNPALTLTVGAVGTVVGAAMTIADWRGFGLVLFLVAASALLVLAALEDERRTLADRVVLTVVGALAALQAVPQTIAWFGEHAGIATGLVMWAVGATVLVLATSEWVRTPIIAQIAGGAIVVGGAAVCGMQSVPLATTFGLANAVVLLAVGTLPDHALMSVFGSIGLLVNVPWSIRYFFPGEGRVPLLIFVSGVVIVGVAVMLTRMGGELRHDLQHHHHRIHLRH